MKKTSIHGKEFLVSDYYPAYRAAPGDVEVAGPQCVHEERIIADLDDYFWKGFSLLQMNKIAGSYVEFGSGATVRSSRIVLKYTRGGPVYPARRMFIFDSFAGLPDPVGIDAHPQWIQGDMAVSEPQFHGLMARHGATRNRDYLCIPGYFNRSLAGKRPLDYGIRHAAFVHIDCDLYSSTVEALNFIIPAMPDGAILSFDDWLCFNGDPDRGEQRAFRELCEKVKGEIDFIPFRTFDWHGNSFILRRLHREHCEEITQNPFREGIACRLEQYMPDIKLFDTVVVYGAGEHTRTLLKEWKELCLPPVTAVTSSDATGGEFDGVPVVSLQSLKPESTLFVLSSHNFEPAMHDTLSRAIPNASILSIWNPELTRLPPDPSQSEPGLA